MTDKLKPCPFCGNAAKVFGEDSSSFMVFCVTDKCNADQYSLTEAEAIAAWNTRAEPEREQLCDCKDWPECEGIDCPVIFWERGQQALEVLRETVAAADAMELSPANVLGVMLVQAKKLLEATDADSNT